MSGAPRQGRFTGLTNEQVEAVATSEEEDSAPDTSGNISVESIEENTEEEEGVPAVEAPEEEEEGLLEDTFEEDQEGLNMADEPWRDLQKLDI